MACNLYPFVKTVEKPDVKVEEAVEQIDIGQSVCKCYSVCVCVCFGTVSYTHLTLPTMAVV